ncbi:MAG: biopolymer transporter ExbD [Candidatus Omnitrophota bacterium]|nr:biopolymer transporter ExbD [Candidatus Omnitrophota bacterium]
MNVRLRKPRAIAEINITPFTDVILVLLIIFMITTPLIVQTSIKVNLPNARSAKTSDVSNQVDITVSSKSIIYLDGNLITKEDLKDKMTALYKNNPSLKVVLFSDRLARFKDVVAVLDIMNELGIKSLNIAAKADFAGK